MVGVLIKHLDTIQIGGIHPHYTVAEGMCLYDYAVSTVTVCVEGVEILVQIIPDTP